ncbi:MAG: hypothetical protein WAO67_05425 [Yoonia sp.]
MNIQQPTPMTPPCARMISDMTGLTKLHEVGMLQFFGDYADLIVQQAFDGFLQPLRKIDWVVYAKELPRAFALPCPCCGGRLIMVDTIAPAQHSRAPPKTARAAA